ncbi:MAG: NusG domain II-containing protein [Lachnospiraceae bacterium]|nr:NusG domain II-containing protein [Lachnospiraceae bacterium]
MKTKKNDFILIGVILLVALLIYGGYRLANMGAGGTILITVNGQEYSRLSLASEGSYLIREGEVLRRLSETKVPDDITDKKYNILTIKNGVASMVEAGCPDLLCVHQKDISLKGEQIVCLPNKVVVSVIDGGENPVDTVTN